MSIAGYHRNRLSWLPVRTKRQCPGMRGGNPVGSQSLGMTRVQKHNPTGPFRLGHKNGKPPRPAQELEGQATTTSNWKQALELRGQGRHRTSSFPIAKREEGRATRSTNGPSERRPWTHAEGYVGKKIEKNRTGGPGGRVKYRRDWPVTVKSYRGRNPTKVKGTDRTHSGRDAAAPWMTARNKNETAFLDMGQLVDKKRRRLLWAKDKVWSRENAKGTNRAKKQVNNQARREIRQGLDQERARDGTREWLRLGHEFRNIGETGITTNEGNNVWKRLELP